MRTLARDAATAAYAERGVGDEVMSRSGESARMVQTAIYDQVSMTERVLWWLDPRPLVSAAPRRG